MLELLKNGPGAGRSGGWPTSYSAQAGQEAGLQFLEKVIKAQKILFCGISYGGGAQAEAILNHQFDEKIKYVVWSDRTFSTLSNAASAIVEQVAYCLSLIVKPLFFLLGIELNGVAAAKKLEDLKIPHIITQNNLTSANNQILIRYCSEKGTDDVIPNQASLAVGLKQVGMENSDRLTCYGSEKVDHNNPLPSEIGVLVERDLRDFF